MRQKALVGNVIVNPHLEPRRIWDLYSNRVVPSWITNTRPKPISHAWVDENDRVNALTLINGKEWPVPVPKDANLDLNPDRDAESGTGVHMAGCPLFETERGA